MPRENGSAYEGLSRESDAGAGAGGASDGEGMPLVHLEEGQTVPAETGGGGGGFPGYSPLPVYLKMSAGALWNYNTKITWMLVFVPITFVFKMVGASEGFIFFGSLLALIPLAALLGCTTEALASYTNQTLGGLLNATFGNATEVIISVIALAEARPENQMIRVIQLSLLGSILSNLLLVLGCAFIAGGYRMMTHPDSEKKKTIQTYNADAANVNSSMLVLSVICLVLPDVLFESQMIGHCALLTFSRFVSVMMLGMYGVFLWFQLVTHQEMFEDEDEEEEDEELGFHGSLAWMAVLTIFISIFSEYLVEAIEPTSRDWGVPYLFIGVILIPIVGNAAEHATAVVMAYKDKMEITMGVAVGSSVQVAVFVIPFMVVSAWLFDIPLDLNFHPFETATVFLSVIIVNVVIANGNSTYLEGIMLLLLYIFISAGFIMHDPEEAHCTQNQLCGWEDLACLGPGNGTVVEGEHHG